MTVIALHLAHPQPSPWTASVNSSVFWIIWMVVALWCELVSADRDSTTLSTTPQLGCTCSHLLNERLLMLHPNEHVGNLDLLQELFLQGKEHQRHTIRPLYSGRRTFDHGSLMSPLRLLRRQTHHLVLCASWESDLRDCGTVPNQRLRYHVRVWAHFVRCCVAVTSHPQPPLRRGHGCTVGVNRDPPV